MSGLCICGGYKGRHVSEPVQNTSRHAQPCHHDARDDCNDKKDAESCFMRVKTKAVGDMKAQPEYRGLLH